MPTTTSKELKKQIKCVCVCVTSRTRTNLVLEEVLVHDILEVPGQHHIDEVRPLLSGVLPLEHAAATAAAAAPSSSDHL